MYSSRRLLYDELQRSFETFQRNINKLTLNVKREKSMQCIHGKRLCMTCSNNKVWTLILVKKTAHLTGMHTYLFKRVGDYCTIQRGWLFCPLRRPSLALPPPSAGGYTGIVVAYIRRSSCAACESRIVYLPASQIFSQSVGRVASSKGGVRGGGRPLLGGWETKAIEEEPRLIKSRSIRGGLWPEGVSKKTTAIFQIT